MEIRFWLRRIDVESFLTRSFLEQLRIGTVPDWDNVNLFY
jgi:hypothetical protein